MVDEGKTTLSPRSRLHDPAQGLSVAAESAGPGSWIATHAPGSQVAHMARRILDHFGVQARLEDIRDSVWRGGAVAFGITDDPVVGGYPRDVYYELSAYWETAVFERQSCSEPSRQLALGSAAVLEGAWRRVRAGYSLRIGIDAQGIPIALYVRSSTGRYLVPYVGRGEREIARALDTCLARIIHEAPASQGE